MRRHTFLSFAVFLISASGVTAQVLNMSQDLVSLGIASQNMTPNNSSLDSRPLFQAALNYVQSHPAIQTVTVNTGSYYLLSNTQANGVLMFANLTNLTVDLAGSTLYFNGPLVPNGIDLYYCTNLTLTNFQIDYVHAPYTHVQVTSIDTVKRLLKYQTLSGWPDPSGFNSLVDPFSGGPIQGYWATIFRNGSIVPGTTRMLLQAPFTNSTLTIQDQSPWAQSDTLATLQAGDTAVVYARGGGPIMWIFFGSGLTLSNIAIYGSQGIQLVSASNTTLKNVRFEPRPGAGLIGGVGGVSFLPPGPNNHILNCYVARTIDDALTFEDSGPGTVVSQASSTQITAANQGYRFPNGSTMNFVDPGTTAEIAGGIIVSQSPPDNLNPAPGNVQLTFDRTLPTLPAGTIMVFGDATQRGQGSTVEDTLVEDTYGGRGIQLNGVEGMTIQRNVVRRTSMAGIIVDQSADAAVDAADLNPPSHNVTITDNVVEGALGPAPCGTGMQVCLGAVEVVSTNNQAFAFSSSPVNTSITVQNNYIADSGRSGIWIGELSGGTLQNNLVIRYSRNPTLGDDAGIPQQFVTQVQADALLPVVIHYSSGVSETGDTISATSSVVAPVALMPAGIMWPSAGGSASFNIQTAITGFNWKAVSDSSWLTITSPATGSGAGTIEYSVAANTSGSSRTGVITIAGETFVVKQQSTASLVSTKAGIWRPSAFNMVAEDADGNLAWDSPPDQANFFGANGDIVIFGDWDGSGKTRMGIFRPSVGMFALDMNGNGAWDPGIDTFGFFGQNGDVPIVGDWTGDGKSKIGIFRPTTGLFALDINNNLTWDQGVDLAGKFGQPNDVPIVGKWTNDGKSKVGIFRNGLWELDTNGNLAWESGVDSGGTIGQAGDRPIFGDWNGDGRTKVGIYRPSTGLFGLDYNGNLAWDTGIDMGGVLGPANASPVVGDWTGTGIDRVGILYGSGYWALDTNGAILWDSGIRWGAFGAAGDTAVVGKWQ